MNQLNDTSIEQIKIASMTAEKAAISFEAEIKGEDTEKQKKPIMRLVELLKRVIRRS